MKDYALAALRIPDLQVLEGSGISRENRISPAQMLRVLQEFMPRRSLLPRKGALLFKTGSLNGIRTRVGYVEAHPGHPTPSWSS